MGQKRRKSWGQAKSTGFRETSKLKRLFEDEKRDCPLHMPNESLHEHIARALEEQTRRRIVRRRLPGAADILLGVAGVLRPQSQR